MGVEERDALFEILSGKEPDELRPEKKNGSSYGYAIQNDLVQVLLKSTKYVRSESSVMRFDVAAYIPKDQRVGFQEDTQISCSKKFNRNHCRLLWESFREETMIPNEQYMEECRIAREKAEADGDKYHWISLDSIHQYRLGEESWKWDEPDMYNSLKDCCKCPNEEDCPTLMKEQEEAKLESENGLFLTGLHLFEIKSDLDVEHRLVHQLPSMYGLANYAWLVLGEKWETPVWLPPWIGVLRYKEEDHSFKVERKTHLINELPAMHTHWMKAHGVTEGLRPSILRHLFYKWSINSMFGWADQEIVLDMTHELQELCKINKWGKRVSPDTLQKKLVFNQSLEEFA